jgi:hypothetical protein
MVGVDAKRDPKRTQQRELDRRSCSPPWPLGWSTRLPACTVEMRALFMTWNGLVPTGVERGGSVPCRRDQLSTPHLFLRRSQARGLVLVGVLIVALFMHLFGQSSSPSHAGVHGPQTPVAATAPAHGHGDGDGDGDGLASAAHSHLAVGHIDEAHAPCGEARAPASQVANLPTSASPDTGLLVGVPSRGPAPAVESSPARGRDVVRELGVQRV